MSRKHKHRRVPVLNGSAPAKRAELAEPSVTVLLPSPTPLVQPPVPPLRLDLGCGSNKRVDGTPWVGVDTISFPGVDVVTNLCERWPWEDNTVTEVHASHVVEHFNARERVHFVNELYRALIPGGKATIICPHWASCRAYGDPTHEWPPVSEFWFFYLSREWRLGNKEKGVPANAPHTDATYWPGGFACNFEATWGYALHPAVQLRNSEAQQFAVQYYKEAVQDLIATLIKR